MDKKTKTFVDNVLSQYISVLVDIIDAYYSQTVALLKSQMADAYEIGQSIDGQPWMGNEQSTTRWRRHYIAKGSYKRVSKQVPILGVDEDDVMILSGITRDKVIESIYYDLNAGDIIIPDNSTINKFFDSDTTTIILNNLDRKPIFPDNAEKFLERFYDIADAEIIKQSRKEFANILTNTKM